LGGLLYKGSGKPSEQSGQEFLLDFFSPGPGLARLFWIGGVAELRLYGIGTGSSGIWQIWQARQQRAWYRLTWTATIF
jgi:hypothetical protein